MTRRAKAAPAAPWSGAATQEIGFLLQRAHRRMRAELNEALRPLNLNVGHLGVMGLLFNGEGLTQQQLISILEIDKSSMVYLIDELERQGLAERRSVSGDRRAYAIHLTDAGRQRLAVVGSAARDVQDRFLAPLTARERVQLRDLLGRVGG
jgi:DNA-binding MarR family transcriptional regulator